MNRDENCCQDKNFGINLGNNATPKKSWTLTNGHNIPEDNITTPRKATVECNID